MARVHIDQTGNEDIAKTWAKINAMFTELYGSVGTGDAEVDSITTSGAAEVGTDLEVGDDVTVGGDAAVTGALTAASAAVTGAVGGATAAITGVATVGDLKLGAGSKTAAATAGAATLASPSGVITSEALTTAAAASYTLTITDTEVAATDICFASVSNGTNSAGLPRVVSVTPDANSLVVVIRNDHATDALNGTIKVAFAALKA